MSSALDFSISESSVSSPLAMLLMDFWKVSSSSRVSLRICWYSSSLISALSSSSSFSWLISLLVCCLMLSTNFLFILIFMITFDTPHFRTDQPVRLHLKETKAEQLKVEYLTDVVFEPKTYEIRHKLEGNGEEQGRDIVMDFSFAEEEAKTHNQMINNIGLLKINGEGIERKMALILSKEKDGLYLTFIATQGK